jgi:two-component sensor histidine kinase/CHASE3 domain sensor protein
MARFGGEAIAALAEDDAGPVTAAGNIGRVTAAGNIGRVTAAGDIGRLTAAASLPIFCGLFLLLIICGTAAYQAVISRDQADDAAKAVEIANSANGLRAQLLIAESSQRGFLLTSRPEYREPYDAAVTQARVIEQHLAERVAGDVPAVQMAARVNAMAEQKIGEMNATLALANAGHHDAALARVNTDAGLRLMNDIQAILATLRHSAATQREAAFRAQSSSNSVLLGAIGFAALGAMLMAALSVLQVRRQLRLLRRREWQLDRLVNSLEGRVQQRTMALAQANQRFQIALDSSEITVFSQNENLVYGWVSRGTPEAAVGDIIGKTDAGFQPDSAAVVLERIKRGVLASGEPVRTEVRIDYPSGTHWYDMTLVPTRNAEGAVDGLIGGAVDISERKQHDAHVRLLLREITHRSKNLLAVIQAIMRQTASHALSVGDFTKRFSARLDALAGSLDLLVQEDWRGVTLADLVRSQLAHHADAGASQIELEGGKLQLPPDAAQNIGMALHELATNAAKYGALSVPEGRVRVSWQSEMHANGQEFCRLSWEECNGPPVTPPSRRGFGQVVIERTVARAVGGKVTLSYPPEGVRWTLEFHLRSEPVEEAA